MKILIGAGVAALVAGGFVACPEHVRDQISDATEIPPEVHAEVSRQIDAFVEVMSNDWPALVVDDSRE